MNTSHIASSKHLINAQVINSLGSLGSGFYCLSSGNREMSVLGSSVVFPGPRSKPGVVPEWRWHPLSFWPGGLLFPCWWAEEWNRWEVVQRVLEDGSLPFSGDFGSRVLGRLHRNGNPPAPIFLPVYQVCRGLSVNLTKPGDMNSPSAEHDKMGNR